MEIDGLPTTKSTVYSDKSVDLRYSKRRFTLGKLTK